MKKLTLHASLALLAGIACRVGAVVKDPSLQSIYVGGWGDWQYVYEPRRLDVPIAARVEHAHGIAVQDDGTIIVTYKDAVDDSKCLLRWRNCTTSCTTAELLGPGRALCQGVPHGLRAAVEDDGMSVLYHANNEQALYKTSMEGDIIWSQRGQPNSTYTADFKPTWFAAQPGSPWLYMADGYGSSRILVYDRKSGQYTGHVFGGIGTDHGQFQTCHAITWDPRSQEMVVCDRENHRLEYFQVQPSNPATFEYSHTVSFYPLLQRPCNIRIRSHDGMAIVPGLEGTVGILNQDNDLISLINVTAVLGDRGFLHPHDAHFMPGLSGDFVLATWNPGRIGYFRRIQPGDPTMASPIGRNQ